MPAPFGYHRPTLRRRPPNLYPTRPGSNIVVARFSLLTGHRITKVTLVRTIYRRWRTFPCGRTSDGNRIASQIGRFFLLDLSCFVATGVPSHFRKQRTVSIGHASGVRFVSRAFSPFLPFNHCKHGKRYANTITFVSIVLCIGYALVVLRYNL